MEDQKVIEQLTRLGINNSEQFDVGDIFYWHLKKFKELKDNQEELIKLNDALQEIQSFEEKSLKDLLDSQYEPNTDNEELLILKVQEMKKILSLPENMRDEEDHKKLKIGKDAFEEIISKNQNFVSKIAEKIY